MEIRIEHLSKSFGKKQVLRDITFSAVGGKCIGILGVNGCGKSTLLSLLAGVQRADGGAFYFESSDLFQDEKRRQHLVGYVPQGTPLIEELNGWDNLLLWYDRETLKKELDGGVLKVLGVDAFLKTTVSKMSGGMKKRLSIGCAMAQKPPVLLLDEPTAALDLSVKKDILRYLSQYKKSGGLLVMTSHDPIEFEMCDECYIMREGVLHPFAYDGNIHTLMEKL